VGLRTGLNAVEKRKISYPCPELNPGRPARSLSLYPASTNEIALIWAMLNENLMYMLDEYDIRYAVR
jgi:hypothetical protein